MNPKDKVGATKPNLSVLPFAPLYETVAALYEGRRKYGPWNWRGEKVSESIYADAAIRHLMQFLAGEDVDPDSGLPHVIKAIAGLLILRDAQLHGCSSDDRMVDQNLQITEVMAKMAAINDRYPEQAESNLPPRQAFPGRPANSGTIDEDGADEVLTRSVKSDRDIIEYLHEGESDEVRFSSEKGEVRFTTEPKVQADVTYSDKGLDGSTRVLCRWSHTKAGGGSYEIKEWDVGKKVEYRNGEHGTIGSWEGRWEWPVTTAGYKSGHVTTTIHGQQHSKASEVYAPELELPHDIVKVFHP